MEKKVLLIADTHFGVENIILYENRPFIDIEEMNEKLISNWNSVVGENDEVFLLGDFSAHGSEKSQAIGHSLNGKKTLILGNHDDKGKRFYYECGFENVIEYPIIYNGFFILSHEPLYINTNMPYANIFGHVHGNPMYATVTSQSFCVSVERIDYKPIEISEIINRMKAERKK